MTAAEELFSIQVVRMNGETLSVDGLQADDTLGSLAYRLCDALSVPTCQAASRLKLLLGDRDVSVNTGKSQLLRDVGIGPGAVLSLTLKAETQFFEHIVNYQYDGPIACDQTRLLLLDNRCLLVRKQFDPNDCPGHENRPLQFDILYGSYEVEDGLRVGEGWHEGWATFSWEVHLQRKIEYDLSMTQKLGDSGWKKMDKTASFRWRRLEMNLTGMYGINRACDALAAKLAGMTGEELEKAMQDDMRANGVEEDDLYTNKNSFVEVDEDDLYNEVDDNAQCLRDNLVQFYRGMSPQMKLKGLVRLRMRAWSALIPGELLGQSMCWTRRLTEVEKQVAGEGSLGSVLPGLDFSSSSLLGIKLTENIREEKLLDLSDLPQLLGF